MEELIKVIIGILLTISLFAIIVVGISSLIVMSKNVSKGETFIFASFLPVFETRIFNEKGKVARKIYNGAFYGGIFWAVLFLGYRYVFL